MVSGENLSLLSAHCTLLAAVFAQIHRAFHIAALIVAVVGFALAFIANKNDNGLITLGSENVSLYIVQQTMIAICVVN